MSNKVTIMVIDDEIHMRRLIKRVLEREGFIVAEMGSGTEALKYLSNSANKPGLVTCDISMPDINGFEILGFIRQTPELMDLPVIMLTAMGQTSDADRARKMGATGYITKPFSAHTLINLVRQHAVQKMPLYSV